MSLDTLRLATFFPEVLKDIDRDLLAYTKTAARITPLFPQGTENRREIYSLDRRKYSKTLKSCGAYFEISKELIGIGTAEKIVLNMSAKVLGKDYLKGISENSFEQAIDSINAHAKGHYTIDKHEAFDRFHIEVAHNNINVPVCEREVIPIIESLKNTLSWNYKKNDNRFLTTARLHNKSEKMSFYSKKHELCEGSKDFYELLGGDKIPSSIRVEHQAERAAKARKVYSRVPEAKEYFVQSGNLQVPLRIALKENVSAKVLKDTIEGLTFDSVENELITDTGKYFSLFSDTNQSWNQIKKEFGLDGIFRRLNCSEAMLREVLKARGMTRNNVSRTVKEFRQAVNRVSYYDSENKINSLEIVQDFKERLDLQLSELLRAA